MATSRSRTHCAHGHEFTDENTYPYLDVKGKPRRKCRACTLERSRKQSEEGARQRREFRVKQGGKPARTGKRTDECISANDYLALVEQKERAATWWEREEIEQRMKDLRIRGA